MSINSDHTAGSQPTPDHSPIHTMESDLQKFPSSRNIPLKITLYRLNKALSICQHLKIQILSDQNKNISKDKISSREHLLSKKLTYAREQLLGFQYDNIAIVQFYQDILLKTAPDLHHAIFVSYHDDLI